MISYSELAIRLQRGRAKVHFELPTEGSVFFRITPALTK